MARGLAAGTTRAGANAARTPNTPRHGDMARGLAAGTTRAGANAARTPNTPRQPANQLSQLGFFFRFCFLLKRCLLQLLSWSVGFDGGGESNTTTAERSSGSFDD